MSARFEFAFPCSPDEISRYQQSIGLTVRPSLARDGSNRDCDQDHKSPFQSTAYRPAAGPRGRL